MAHLAMHSKYTTRNAKTGNVLGILVRPLIYVDDDECIQEDGSWSKLPWVGQDANSRRFNDSRVTQSTVCMGEQESGSWLISV